VPIIGGVVTRRAEILIIPPPGMASRELTVQVGGAPVSNWLASALMLGKPSGISVSIVIMGPRDRSSISDIPETRALISTAVTTAPGAVQMTACAAIG